MCGDKISHKMRMMMMRRRMRRRRRRRKWKWMRMMTTQRRWKHVRKVDTQQALPWSTFGLRSFCASKPLITSAWSTLSIRRTEEGKGSSMV